MEELMPGSIVTLHFSLQLTDGTEAFNTHDEPLNCELGDGTLLPGLELALYGLRVDDEQTLTLTPEQAWGERSPELLKEIPLANFPEEQNLQPGQVLAFSLPDGDETTGTILAINDESVRIDFNHPLSGHDVVFSAKIIAIDNSGIPQD
jgi:FKBP-type peptidyl-prolyl cis-trans isomerase SlpA